MTHSYPNSLQRGWTWLWNRTGSLLLGRFCALCQLPVAPSHSANDPLGGTDRLCRSCEMAMAVNVNCCNRCALPLPFAVERCGRCLRKRLLLTQIVAPFRYAAPLDQLLIRFKKTANLSCGRAVIELWLPHLQIKCAQVLKQRSGSTKQVLKQRSGSTKQVLKQRSGSTKQEAAPTRPDALVAVPMHVNRLRERGFNQALLLANAASERFAVPVLTLLERTRDTPSQGGLRRAQRQQNMRGAFAVRDANAVHGKHIVLIDDVATTASTLNACALALLRAGAKRVDAWVVARA
jgi:ComF family protein